MSERAKNGQEEMFVNGSFIDAYSTEKIDVINPATEQSIGVIVDGDERDVDRAVRAAHEAFLHSGWRHLRPSERAQYIRALADALEQRAEEMATLVTSENGMPITIARAGHGP